MVNETLTCTNGTEVGIIEADVIDVLLIAPDETLTVSPDPIQI